MKNFFLFCLSCMYIASVAQNTNIGGQINKYSRVTSVIYCGNRVTVDTPSLFQPGMQVLIIQMQGATIDESNTGTYGNITAYGPAGNYEILTIDSVIGDTVRFTYQLQRSYNAAQSVQLIPLPVYQTATVSSVLTCKPWGGATGGVLLLQADTLVLHDTIDITGTGFRGFYENDSSQLCFGDLLDYYYTDSMHGGIKGQGIVQYPYLFGRGKNANGGGGGNNQNTGGGGGGNFGLGGVGGQIIYRTILCQGLAPGQGGAGLTYSDSLNKAFMGGGGGCGHGNNSEGTPGTNGAGICLIIANVVVGNNQYILANGIDQLNIAGSDGAGGAGAGGTVLLNVGQYAGNLTVVAKGGIGGSLNNDYLTRSCMGPGGGGGGGVLWVSQPAVPANISYSAPGGPNGFNLDNVGTFCPYGVTNGAMPGDSGGIVTGLSIPEAADTFIRLHGTISNDTVLCNDQQITLSASGIASDSVYYSWSTGQNTPAISFLASQDDSFSVTVTDQAGCIITKQVFVKVYVVSPVFSPDMSLCTPQLLTLSAANPGATAVTYGWSTGAGTPTITFMADSSQAYTVTVYSDSLPTCRAADTIAVTVGHLAVTFSPAADTSVCPGNPVYLSANISSGSGVNYIWSTGDTTSSITVTPLTASAYGVTVTAAGGCISTHSFAVGMDFLGISPPLRDTAICPGGQATLTAIVPNATGLTYRWSDGETAQQISVMPPATQTYAVTVTSANGCSGIDSATIIIDSVRVAGHDTTTCPGSVAMLTAYASGIGQNISYLWSGGQTGQTITVTPAASQSYAVTATDSLGCRASDSLYVTTGNAADNLSIQITAVPDSAAEPGDTVQLSVTGSRLLSFIWSPGIYLSDSTVQSPIDTPLKSTVYCVVATDSNNCKAEVCKEIGVGIPPAQIALPDAFTPNGDGMNDLYIVQALAGTIISSVNIYDRWGMLLYHDDNNQGWDGAYKGVAQMAGTYTCFVSYYQKLYPGLLFYRSATFNLLR
jgi:gliding motility-associated-like protein